MDAQVSGRWARRQAAMKGYLRPTSLRYKSRGEGSFPCFVAPSCGADGSQFASFQRADADRLHADRPARADIY